MSKSHKTTQDSGKENWHLRSSGAFREARDMALAHGCSVVESKHGRLVEVSASGEVRDRKPLEPAIKVTRGSKIKIR